MTLRSGNDTTISGGDVSAAKKLTANVGGDLTLESLQNLKQSSSSSFGVSGGPSGYGFNVGGSSSQSQQSTALANLRSGTGTDVTVGGTTTLTGGGITSANGSVNLTTRDLVATNLADSATSSSFNFGVSGIGGEGGLGGSKPGGGAFKGNLSIGMSVSGAAAPR